MAIQPAGRGSRKSLRFEWQRNLFHVTRFGGVPLLRKVWEICRIDRHLRDLAIIKRGHPAELLTFAYVLAPWLGADSVQQLAHRFNDDAYLREGLGAGRRLGPYDWSRFLGGFELRGVLTAAVTQMQSWGSTACCGSRGVLALDDTAAEKTGRKMQGIGTLWDNAKQRFIRGYAIVNLTYHGRGICYPVDYRLAPKQKGERTGGKHTLQRTTKISLAKQLIDTAHRLGLAVRAVVFDSGYCALELLRHLDERGYHWVSRLPRNRIVFIGGKRLSVKQLLAKRWYKDDPVRGVRYFCRQGYLNNYELPVQFVIIKEPGRDPIALVSSLIETPWQEIRWLYQQRHDIETFHRDAKQRFGLAAFHCRDLRRIDNHVALAYLGYLLAALMKLVYPELRDLGWLAIRDRIVAVAQMLVLRGDAVRTFLVRSTTPLLRRLAIRYLSNNYSLAPC